MRSTSGISHNFCRFRTRAARSVVLALMLAAMGLMAASTRAQAQEDAVDQYSTIAAYLVRDGKIGLDPESAEPAKADDRNYRAVWDHVLSVLPREVLARVSRFELFAYEVEMDTESDANTALDEDGKSWILAVNWDSAKALLKGSDKASIKEFDATLVHEAAHILALSPDQMQDGSKKTAGTYVVEEGATRPDAYLNKFWLAFWKGRYPEFKGQELDYESATALNAEHPGAFVTDYAASSPNEDFAESFAAFVTSPKPTGKAEKDQKLAFFWAWPELVAMRDYCRKGMGIK